MKKFVTIGYSYDELNDEAKERVKQWYLDDPFRNDEFCHMITDYLNCNFPRSELEVHYSLSYCQGDGLNIHGRLNMFDFLDKWNACDEVKHLIEKILNNTDHWYNFATDNHYCYSCKFIDRKYIDEDVSAKLSDLENSDIADYTEIIKQFYTDIVNYFETLDKKFENDGYKYLYECDEEEVADHCEANDYYFTETGEFIG